jgi:MFS transporter, ACS family, hexuronate transporter
MPSTRRAAWKWWVCGLLLLATTINYMDRLTLNQTARRVMDEVGFDERGYGDLESAFAYAFALGAILAGWLADRVNVRWLYPAALLAWSAAGLATGLVHGFAALLACRFFLGVAEAGHWPCALRTTQRLLPPAERSLGNSLLQSGAAVGAVLTPLLVLALPRGPGTWRYPFLVVGATGVGWVLLWLASVRSAELRPGPATASPAPTGLLLALAALFGLKNAARWATGVPAWLPLVVSFLVSAAGVALVLRWLGRSTGADPEPGRHRGTFRRRLGVLVVVVVTINATWHFFRAWLPLFLQNQHGYTEGFMNGFMMAYYAATDAGSLAAGSASLALARRDMGVHAGRLAVFAACAGLCALSLAAAFLPPGPLLLGVLAVIGFGALGLFPNYYSFSQELSERHQGKVTGALGCSCWLALAPVHEAVGELVQRTGSYTVGVAVAGLPPLLAVAALTWLWGEEPVAAHEPFAQVPGERTTALAAPVPPGEGGAANVPG